MTELIVMLSTGKGTWAEVAHLIKSQPWSKVFIITNDFGKDFKSENAEVMVANFNKPIKLLRDDIHKMLNGKIKDLEVALNIVSGTGKEHMALLAAILKLGVGVRLVALENNEFLDL